MDPRFREDDKAHDKTHDKNVIVFPAQAGIHPSSGVFPLQAWIPAFARMTKLEHFIFCREQRFLIFS